MDNVENIDSYFNNEVVLQIKFEKYLLRFNPENKEQ
jgi:hypothetical protein